MSKISRIFFLGSTTKSSIFFLCVVYGMFLKDRSCQRESIDMLNGGAPLPPHLLPLSNIFTVQIFTFKGPLDIHIKLTGLRKTFQGGKNRKCSQRN